LLTETILNDIKACFGTVFVPHRLQLADSCFPLHLSSTMSTASTNPDSRALVPFNSVNRPEPCAGGTPSGAVSDFLNCFP
jgi:hypothetical protein